MKHVDLWLESRPSNTAKSYRSSLEALRIWFDRDFHELRRPDVEAWANELRATHYSQSTVELRLGTLRRFIGWAAGHPDFGDLYAAAAKEICVPAQRKRKYSTGRKLVESVLEAHREKAGQAVRPPGDPSHPSLTSAAGPSPMRY